jgi:hypothetical protein
MGKRNVHHDAVDRERILAALEQTRGNVTHAALLLGYTRKGLQLAIARLGIVRQSHTAYLSTQVRNEVRESEKVIMQPVARNEEESDLSAYLSGTDSE